jgi:DNA-binding response OmpR family regulator
MKTPILVVEDETIVSMEICSYLETLNLEVIGVANNAKDAYILACEYKPHIILMDIKLKGEIDGISIASRIIKKINTTIIYITAYCDESTVERAIKTNPSAYLIKPFNKQELFASLKMAASSYNKKNDTNKGVLILDDEFSYDTKNSQIIYNSEYLHLTKKEIELLNLLITSKNSIVSIYEIENEIWPDKIPNENTRRALVSRLRAKMKYKFIETIPSIGYRINIQLS